MTPFFFLLKTTSCYWVLPKVISQFFLMEWPSSCTVHRTSNYEVTLSPAVSSHHDYHTAMTSLIKLKKREKQKHSNSHRKAACLCTQLSYHVSPLLFIQSSTYRKHIHAGQPPFWTQPRLHSWLIRCSPPPWILKRGCMLIPSAFSLCSFVFLSSPFA